MNVKPMTLRVYRHLLAAALAMLCCSLAARAGTSLVSDSPFAPAGSPGASAATASDSFQLAGSTSAGGDVSVCIYAQQTRRSLWIPVGGESDGVHVVSFDNANDIAVVSVAGTLRQLTMRKATVSGNRPAAAQAFAAVEAPSAPAAAAPEPQTQEVAVREQREARMLVSDLLEIGVQQRKAYQEAKAKAAAANPPQP